MPEPNYANVFSDFELALPTFWFSHCFSTAQSCPILCDPMDCSSPGSCPSLSPRVCSNSCPLNWWCHPTTAYSATPFSCPQSFPTWRSFPVSQLFVSGGQTAGASEKRVFSNLIILYFIPTSLIAKTVLSLMNCIGNIDKNELNKSLHISVILILFHSCLSNTNTLLG